MLLTWAPRRWSCFHTSNPLGSPQSCVAKRRRGETPTDFRKHFISVLCTTFPGPPFSTVLGTAPVVLQIHLWAPSLQQAPAKPQRKEVFSLFRSPVPSLQRMGNPCRKAQGSWAVAGGDRPLQKVMRVFKRRDYKSLEICTPNSQFPCATLFLPHDSASKQLLINLSKYFSFNGLPASLTPLTCIHVPRPLPAEAAVMVL